MSNQRWQPEFEHQDMEIVSDEVICDSFYQMREVVVEHARFAGGRIRIKRDLFWRPDAVCVLLYDPCKHRVVLIEQFRIGTIDHPHSPWLLELVAGLVEQGEKPDQVAHRESAEEAGVSLLALEHICRFTPSPGGVREYIDLFCGCVDSAQAEGIHGLEDEGEDIRVHGFDADEAIAMVGSGAVDNAPAIIALQWLQLNKARLQTDWSSLVS